MSTITQLQKHLANAGNDKQNTIKKGIPVYWDSFIIFEFGFELRINLVAEKALSGLSSWFG